MHTFSSKVKILGSLCLFISLHAGITLAQVGSRPDPGAGGTSSNRGNHVIRGKIFLPSGRFPDVRMRVVLELVTGGIFSETFSDSVGGFEFRALPNNTYRIVVPSDGYRFEKAEESMEISGGVSRTFVSQLYLKEKRSDAEMVNANRMVSAGELSQDVPKNAKKSYEQGMKKIKDGRPDDAVGYFTEALKIYPDYVLAINKIGEYQVAKGQFADAEARFRRAVEISPKFPLTQINLGLLMVQMKRFSEAIDYLETANRLDESFPVSHLNLGIAYLERSPQLANDLDRAELSFSKTLAMGGKQFAQVHKFLFNIHVRKQNYAQAVIDLESYLENVPAAPDGPQVQEMIAKVKKAAQANAPKQK